MDYFVTGIVNDVETAEKIRRKERHTQKKEAGAYLADGMTLGEKDQAQSTGERLHKCFKQVQQ